MSREGIKRSELLHFSQPNERLEALKLSPEKRAELVENAMAFLYRTPAGPEREELLALIQTIASYDQTISNLFSTVAYVVCDEHLTITFINNVFLRRVDADKEELLGRSLYYERAYEGTQIEQLYSMVYETRMVADTLTRYDIPGYDGWFVIVVIPLETGGIGVLSKFFTNREELTEARQA